MSGQCKFTSPCGSPGATFRGWCTDGKCGPPPPGVPYGLGREAGGDTSTATPDAINPTHYKSGAVEVIDFIRQQLGDDGFVAYCRGNAIKYHARAGKKTDAPSANDAAKAQWYSQMAAHTLDPSRYADPRRSA